MASVLNFVEKVGQSATTKVAMIGLSFTFLMRIFYSLFSRNFPGREFVQQILFIGSRSLVVVLVASFFTGMVVALQFYDTLVRFGSVDLLGSAVSLSLIRELGPVMTALMVIARVSSATTAEIGIMRNEQQFDALKCMAIDAYQYVLLPRVLAALVSVPILTAIFDLVGIGGGYVVGVVIHGESPGAFVQGIFDTVNAQDVLMGQIKSLVFALVVIWMPLVFGYYLHLDRKNSGAKGVSTATTNAVVTSAILMLVFDYIVSSLML